MRHSFILCPLVALVAATSANAATLYVSPTGTSTAGCTSRADACDLGTGAGISAPGDTVILMDGVYKTSLYLTKSGTEAAWITFKADDCATPIIEGEGVAPTADVQDSGVGSADAEYIRFQGIVSRGWNIGFGNGWIGAPGDVREKSESNGHWEIENCIAYSNGRTGFTFFSAEHLVLKNSIAAHNGSSSKHSWSSGVTLFEAHGTTNRVEGTISFENTERERRTDGNGFIVDEESNNATFINNIAFGNSGSCLRLTRSTGTKFINNTCYHNSQFPDGTAVTPDNPGEIYFTGGAEANAGVTFKNNVIIGTGVGKSGGTAIQNQPSQGWENNVVALGSTSVFTAATGTNPSFVPAAAATDLLGKGTSGNGAPTNDIGFDPKCIVKRAPVMVGQVATETWWQYDVDIEYIQSIGGVAKCFNPAMRTGMPDIGAYKAGAVTTAMPGACVPPAIPEPSGGTGGGGGAGGATAGAGGTTSSGAGGAAVGGDNMGGALTVGGGPSAGSENGGGAGVATAGTAGVGQAGTPGGGGASGLGGSTGTAGTGQPGSGGMLASGSGGSPSGVGGSSSPGPITGGAPAGTPTPGTEDSGCGCRVSPESNPRQSLAAVGLLGLGLLAMQRRRRHRAR
jgi:MYXO-CTERM domain-containing protein